MCRRCDRWCACSVDSVRVSHCSTSPVRRDSIRADRPSRAECQQPASRVRVSSRICAPKTTSGADALPASCMTPVHIANRPTHYAHRLTRASTSLVSKSPESIFTTTATSQRATPAHVCQVTQGAGSVRSRCFQLLWQAPRHLCQGGGMPPQSCRRIGARHGSRRASVRVPANRRGPSLATLSETR